MVEPQSYRDETFSKPLSSNPERVQCPDIISLTDDADPPHAVRPLGCPPGAPKLRLDLSNDRPSHSYFGGNGVTESYSGLFEQRSSLTEGTSELQDGLLMDHPNRQQLPTLDLRVPVPQVLTDPTALSHSYGGYETHFHRSASAISLPRRVPSSGTTLTAAHSIAGSLSPSSSFSSPQLAALTDITPLPSPTLLGGSSWKLGRSRLPSFSAASSATSRSGSAYNLQIIETSNASRSSSIRRKPPSLTSGNNDSQQATPDNSLNGDRVKVHARNRSASEYVPETLHLSQPRKASISGSGRGKDIAASQDMAVKPGMHREEYLAVQRGIALPAMEPPTPPRSTRSGYDSSDTDPVPVLLVPGKSRAQVYVVRSIRTGQPRRYRMLRQLGQGTFSQVVLAVREDFDGECNGIDNGTTSKPQRLVAIKVVEYGPAGGADEERVEISLNREVDILKSINHPSLVQLKAFGSDKKRALLVLGYCPGGDLFEFASLGLSPLGPSLIRRIFAELVSAVRYLHENFIVHRDIKLENVLINIPAPIMQEIPDPRTYGRAVVTLSDLGLSRRIPPPPESPLLRTRCGSEDYAAPEILMGQPYDGRSTDGWALGVLLYAVMESRLPFDPMPGTRGDPAKLRARTPHRIARCEWGWCRFANEEGEWDPVKGRGLEGARVCVEGLLRRSTRRMTLDKIAELEWVRNAIDVPGGLMRGDLEVP